MLHRGKDCRADDTAADDDDAECVLVGRDRPAAGVPQALNDGWLPLHDQMLVSFGEAIRA